MKLKLLLDNADPLIWKEFLPTGIFKGITTNPSLLRDAEQNCDFDNIKRLAQQAKKLKCKELHIQAWGKTSDELTACGFFLSNLSSQSLNIYVKIPLTKEGIQAGFNLRKAKKSITCTACFDVHQVLIASALGATYIAPYLGRITDQGRDGKAEIITMKNALNGIKSNCKLLIASIRDIDDINHLSTRGISTFAISANLARKLFDVPLTTKAAEKFELDAAKQ